MIPVSNGMRVWLATGHTDMRKRFPGLALVVQETLKRDPHRSASRPVPAQPGGGVLRHAPWPRSASGGAQSPPVREGNKRFTPDRR